MDINKYYVKLKEPEAVFERLNSLVNLSLGAVNTIAGRTLYDACEMLTKDKKRFRFSVKKNANEAKKFFDKYESIHLQNFGDRYQLFLDYLDSIEDEVMPHVEKMFWSFKAVLDKNREPDSALKAKVEVAGTMLEYSCYIYDRLIEQTRKASGYDFDRYMRPARLTGASHSWNEVVGIICKTDNGNNIDLNADANSKLAFEIIERMLTSEDTLNRAGYEALKLNPDMLSQIDKKDLEEIKQKFD